MFIIDQNLDFRCHLSTFGAENTLKNRPSESKNNALTIPEQLQNNFQKVQKTTFLTPKMVKTRVSTLAKKVDFWDHFLGSSSNIALFPGIRTPPLKTSDDQCSLNADILYGTCPYEQVQFQMTRPRDLQERKISQVRGRKPAGECFFDEFEFGLTRPGKENQPGSQGNLHKWKS